MDTKIAEYALKLLEKKGASDTVVTLSAGCVAQSKFTNSKITSTMSWNSTDLALLACFGRKVIHTSVKELTRKGVEKAANDCVKFARFAKENNEFQGIAQGPKKYSKIDGLYDKKVETLDSAEIVNKSTGAVHDAGVPRSDGIFQKSSMRWHLLTSNGIDAEDKGTWLYLSIRSLFDKYATGHELAVSRTINNFDYKTAAQNSAETALDSRNPKPGVKGTFDVVFSPLSFANIVEKIGDAASIFEVEAGMSCLAEKQGQRVAGDAVDIYDDGRIPEGASSGLFDAEGTPAQRTTLIKKGIFRNFLHNTSTAKRYKTESTGNAGLIAPHPSNIVVQKGDFKKEELIKDVKKGLYITNLWYTRFQNYAAGDFSTIPRDGMFYIENGKIKHPIKEIRISDNLINIMKNVKALAKDVKQIKGWEVETPVFTPSVLVKNVKITRPET
ncbi:MAG: TldD/PmbA family protein [Candidatus Woesearchaeota archaeon]